MDSYLGGDLRSNMRGRVWSETMARPIIAEVISALRYLHGLKVVHRDVKPDVIYFLWQNIMLDEQGHAFLSDFDLATNFQHTNMQCVGTEPCNTSFN